MIKLKYQNLFLPDRTNKTSTSQPRKNCNRNVFIGSISMSCKIDGFLNDAFTLWSFISYLVVINTECFPFSGAAARYESHTLWINKRVLNIRDEEVEEKEEYRDKREKEKEEKRERERKRELNPAGRTNEAVGRA